MYLYMNIPQEVLEARIAETLEEYGAYHLINYPTLFNKFILAHILNGKVSGDESLSIKELKSAWRDFLFHTIFDLNLPKIIVNAIREYEEYLDAKNLIDIINAAADLTKAYLKGPIFQAMEFYYFNSSMTAIALKNVSRGINIDTIKTMAQIDKELGEELEIKEIDEEIDNDYSNKNIQKFIDELLPKRNDKKSTRKKNKGDSDNNKSEYSDQ